MHGDTSDSTASSHKAVSETENLIHSKHISKQKSDKMGFKEKIQQKFLHPKEDSTRLLESSDEEMWTKFVQGVPK